MTKIKNFFLVIMLAVIGSLGANFLMLLLTKIRGDFDVYVFLLAPSMVIYIFLKNLYKGLEHNKWRAVQFFGGLRMLVLPIVLIIYIIDMQNGVQWTWENDYRNLARELIAFVSTLFILKHLKKKESLREQRLQTTQYKLQAHSANNSSNHYRK